MKSFHSIALKYYFVLTTLFGLQISTINAETDFVRLKEHIPHVAIKNSLFVENVDPEKKISLTFTLPLRNQSDLNELIRQLYDPAHENYKKYLTSEQFYEKFSPSQEDYDQLINYVKSLNLTVSKKHPNRLLLNVEGIASDVETAFDLSLNHYETEDGRKFHAPNNDPAVASSIASIIDGIVGLDNHAVWRAFNKQRIVINEFDFSNRATSNFPSGPNGGFAPKDLKIAYNLDGFEASGEGQSIALFELAGYQASDINTYAKNFGLPIPNLQNITVDGGPPIGIDPEVTLDIELALALAPKSKIYVYEGPNSNQGVLDTYSKIASDNFAKQVSTSWGLGENSVTKQHLQAENAIFMQMASQGQTLFAAAGDSGAYDNYANNGSKTLAVDDPASQPYVTAVGGTRLSVDGSSGIYKSESVWNDGLGNGAGGGGISTVWTIPNWQKNTSGVESSTYRNVPDIALNADTNTGYAIFHGGKWVIFGGTSCAAPLWAAFIALANQELEKNNQSSVGFINPLLYSIGNSDLNQNFNDITVGDNLYYKAKEGYDNASGFGSFNGVHLLASLTNSSSSTPPIINPNLAVAMSHSSPFKRGKSGTYAIAVANRGNGPTSGPVSVQINLPKGLTFKSMSGEGWSFNTSTLTCTQNQVLQPDQAYATIVLKVNVSLFAPSSVTPSATVSGGSSSSNTTANPTTVQFF